MSDLTKIINKYITVHDDDPNILLALPVSVIKEIAKEYSNLKLEEASKLAIDHIFEGAFCDNGEIRDKILKLKE